ncbi:hypothetical protein D3C81_685230 [compost metagenome]
MARRGPRYLRGMNSTSSEVATGYSMPTAMPMTSRSRKMAKAESAQNCPSEATMNKVGPTKNRRLRPRRSVSQPPRKPPKKMPIRAEAAIRPSQKLFSDNAVLMCARATPIMLKT